MSKGSGRRPAAVSQQELANKWAQTFGGRAEGADGRVAVEAATGRLWSASQIERVQRRIDGLRAAFDEPIGPTEGAEPLPLSTSRPSSNKLLKTF